MDRIIVGNAPVSFGIFEAQMGVKGGYRWEEVLDMIAQAGYEATELGPYGYLPTNPEVLKQALETRGLLLGSSFVPVPLAESAAGEQGMRDVLQVASLLSKFGVKHVIVADAGDEKRRKHAGMMPAGWTKAQWDTVAMNLRAIARALQDEFGMSVVIHHHAGTYIETPEEIRRVMEISEPGLVDLLLDTGHLVYGGGDPVALYDQMWERVAYVHFKDIDASKMEEVRNKRLDMDSAWRNGIFVPLGKGCVRFEKLLESMKARKYAGFIIVEQDVVPDEAGVLSPPPFESAKESRQYLRTLGL